ncbi:MAG TPA: NAD(P)H-hydrate dehydratase [Solirubrobacterales bacterium]|nr:NAD(P)H-hydrate dehydratase [Solirubrobacterales bacterium]
MESWLSPLFDAEGIRAVDRWAIEEQGIPSPQLMETAGAALAEAVAGLSPQGPVRIVCGKGNNGGDGEVAARHLRGLGFAVEVANLWGDEGPPADLDAWLQGSGAVVDAIFGTGFAGAPREPADAAIEAINRCGAPVVACDIASGVDASTGEVAGAAVEADLTVSFHAAKLGQRVAPGKWHTGELRVVPIGIPAGAPPEPAGGAIKPAVLSLLPRRGPRSTKFSSGQVAIAGGSRGLTGAVRMSSLAAIRAGAGYATVVVPAELEPVFEAGEPEVMSVGCPGGDGCLGPGSAKPLLRTFERAAAGVLGPGMGRDPGSVTLAREVVGAIAAPLVVDADGLNAFAGELTPLTAREAPTILTPHAGELGRLLGCDSERIATHRLACAREAAAATGAVVVLKGDDTIVTDGERVAVNTVSAPGLATAGSGDVLSGMTAAMLARGLDPFAAACAAVLAHARAGREAARRVGAAESVIATDVIASIAAGLRRDEPVE